MPRLNRGLELTTQYNSLVPQAQSLGIRVRPRVNMHGNRGRIAAMVEDLRNQIAQYNIPVSISGNARTFGTEFEFYLPRTLTRTALARILTDSGIPTEAEGYNHNARNWWKLVTDNSLQNYVSGAELVSPILSGESGIEQVRKALRILISAGCRVNRRCGFHVHVGVKADQARGLSGEGLPFFKNLLKLYRRYDAVLDLILPASRRGNSNHWCRPVSFNEEHLENSQSISELTSDHYLRDKYRKVNLETYRRQGTVEFRQHQGTLDPLKADMWIRFILRMVEAASKKTEADLLSSETTLDKLMELVDLEQSEKNFFKGRAAHFACGGAD